MWPLLTILIFANIHGFAAQKTINVNNRRKFHFGSLAADCAAGEELKICRPACEPTCSEPEPECFRTCSTATCVCLKGFVRMNRMCIPLQACQLFSQFISPAKKSSKRKPGKKVLKRPTPPPRPPKLNRITHSTTPRPTKATPPPEIIIKPARPPPQCGQGQQFTLCVCDSTCQFEKVCKSCVSGCGCFPHFVRGEDGACVPKSQCPKNSRVKTIKIFESPEDEYDDMFSTIKATTTLAPTTTTNKATSKAAEREITGPVPPEIPLRSSRGSPPGINPSKVIGPPSITPFAFFRRRRIERKKAALRKLLLLLS